MAVCAAMGQMVDGQRSNQLMGQGPSWKAINQTGKLCQMHGQMTEMCGAFAWFW